MLSSFAFAVSCSLGADEQAPQGDAGATDPLVALQAQYSALQAANAKLAADLATAHAKITNLQIALDEMTSRADLAESLAAAVIDQQADVDYGSNSDSESDNSSNDSCSLGCSDITAKNLFWWTTSAVGIVTIAKFIFTKIKNRGKKPGAVVQGKPVVTEGTYVPVAKVVSAE